MRGERPVLQPARHPDPAHPVGVHDEWRVTREGVIAAGTGRRLVLWRLAPGKVGRIEARPLAASLVPPDETLAFAPWLTIRTRRRAVIEDAAVVRPREAPAVSVWALAASFARPIPLGRWINTRIDPATARGAAIGVQRAKA